MLNQWFKLAILAFVGIIVGSLAIGAISGFDQQGAPATGIFGTTGGSNTNHSGGSHGPDANAQNGNPGYGPQFGAQYGPQYGQGFAPNGYPGPNGQWGPQQMPHAQGQQMGGGQNPMGGGQDPMGGGMMDMDKNMDMGMGMDKKMGMM